MKRLFFLLWVLLLGASAWSQPNADRTEPTYEDAPALGIALEELPYPFPVHFLPLNLQGQDVRMAYMDVPPEMNELAAPTLPRTTPRGTVLLLHGKNFYGAYWANTIHALNENGYRVIVPDQIGFGKSSKPAINYSFDLLAANTARLLDALGVGQVAVVGHSMGGMLAVRFALRYPGRVSHLILENPIGLEDYRVGGVRSVPLERLYRDELNDTDPAKIRAFYRHYFVRWKPEYERFVEVEARVTHSGEFPRWARSSALTYQMILNQPVRAEFSQLRVPTLLVIGQADRTVVGRPYASESALKSLGNYPALGRAAQRDIPGSRLVELSNVGHIPHLEAPDGFHAALLDFLSR